MDQLSARQPLAGFAALLRGLRAEARLTQEELAAASGLSPRSISDLERGVSRTARKETARLLADALAIAGPARTAFVAAARGKAPTSEVMAGMEREPAGPPLPATLLTAHGGLGLALRDAGRGQLIDAQAVAVYTGSAVACIWLVGLTAATASETAHSRNAALAADVAGTANAVQPSGVEPEDQRLPPVQQALLPLGHALQLALREAVAAALNDRTVALGAGHWVEGVRPREVEEVA